MLRCTRPGSWLAALAFLPAVAAAQDLADRSGDVQGGLVARKTAVQRTILHAMPVLGPDAGSLLRRTQLARTESALRAVAFEVEARLSRPTLPHVIATGGVRSQASPAGSIERLVRPLPQFDMRGIWMPSPDAD